MKQYIFVTLLFCLFFPLYIHAQEQFCGQINQSQSVQLEVQNTFPTVGGIFLPPSGITRALVIFVQFKNDSIQDATWPLNSLPNWAPNFIGSTSGGSFPTGSISQRYYQWSGSQHFELIGSYYPQVVVTSYDAYDRNHYQNFGRVNLDILQKVATDSTFSFSAYDNLTINPQTPYSISRTADDTIDLVIMIYRRVPPSAPSYYFGIAQLAPDLDAWSLATHDGKRIKSEFANSGVTLTYWPASDSVMPFNDAVGLTVHEVGHKLFGAFHFIDNFAMLGSLSNQWGGSAFNALERRWLGWSNDFFYANSDSNVITLRDFFTTGDAAAVKIGVTPNDWVILENRQKIDPYDRAQAQGLYVYQFCETQDLHSVGMLRILSADGMWNWSWNGSMQQAEKASSNAADGYTKLEQVEINSILRKPPGFPGNNQDPFNVGSKTLLSLTTNPGMYARNGTPVATRIELLSNSNGVMTISISRVPPPSPTLSTPTDSSLSSSPSPTFRWNHSPTATSYHLQVSTNINFQTLVIDRIVTDTSFTTVTPESLYGSRTYFWHVNATNQYGTSNWSDPRLLAMEPVLSFPTLFAPSNGTTNASIAMTFQWRRVDRSNSYRFELSKYANFSDLARIASLSDTTYAVTSASSNK